MEPILDSVQAENKVIVYAGFWLRVGAIIVDSILLWIFQTVLSLALFGAMAVNAGNLSSLNMGLLVIYYIIIVLGQWIYYAGMESSSRQATIGKMAVGIKVTDLNGDAIGFANATGRYFAKFVSAIIIGIGFLMAGFTEKKQALHDMIAGTLVIKK
jgi:uncharacterized RDD family membrane protein YckC